MKWNSLKPRATRTIWFLNTNSTKMPPPRMKVNSMKRKKKHKLFFQKKWFITIKLKSSSKIKISHIHCFYTPNLKSLSILIFLQYTIPFFILKSHFSFLYPSDNLYDKIPTLSDINITFSNHPVQRTHLFSYISSSLAFYTKIMIINYH